MLLNYSSLRTTSLNAWREYLPTSIFHFHKWIFQSTCSRWEKTQKLREILFFIQQVTPVHYFRTQYVHVLTNSRLPLSFSICFSWTYKPEYSSTLDKIMNCSPFLNIQKISKTYTSTNINTYFLTFE